jgi:Ser/Thr protein kinase RdoA (MazF antagonist)
VSSSQRDVQPDLASLVQAFGLAGADPASLTPFARVHRARTTDGAEVVLKRTATRTAQPLATWTRALADHGVAVVSPAPLEAPNPQQIGDEEWWVVYPYVSGKVYRGDLEQIEEAGALLGRLHAAPVDVSHLRAYRWPTPDVAEVTQECATIEENFARYAPEAREACMTAVRDLGRRWSAGTVETLRDADLPLVGVSSDYKASNLVYTDSGPVLVDPDNGGREPRILDLALALVLFHNECASAPARLFDGREWGAFFSGYRRHVDLTATERRLWPLALEHMLWDEGTWVLEDPDQLDWSDPRQRDFMVALAQAWPGAVESSASLAARFPLS